MVSPAPIRVARRDVILYTLLLRYTADTKPDHPTTKETLELLPTGLERLEMGSEVEPWDIEILVTPLGELDREQRADARWCGEAIGILAWGLQRVAAPADFDPVDPNTLLPAIGLHAAAMLQGAQD